MTKSAQHQKRESVRALLEWYYAVGHEGLKEYVRQGKLNRTLIAKELAFARSAWGSNARLAKALRGIEGRLKREGILASPTKTSATELPQRDRQAAQRSRDSMRLKLLEQKNADLQTQLDEAHDKLKELKVFEEFLAETGRAAR